MDEQPAAEDTEAPAETRNPVDKKASDDRRREWVPSLLQALLVAAVGLVSVWYGGKLSRDSTLDSVRQQQEAGLDAQQREQKSKAYSDFIDAANDASVAVEACIARMSCGTPSDIHARYELRLTYRGVYVYGSDAAVTTANVLYSMIPEIPDVPTPFVNKKYDSVLFNAMFDEFRNRMCVELAARPREGCHPVLTGK